MTERRSISGATRSGRATGSAVRDGLVSGNGRLALVGLIAALVTLGFSVWLKVDSRKQVEVRVPLAAAATQLDAAIVSSFAWLEAWIIIGNDRSRDLRAREWREGIAPAFARLQRSAQVENDPVLAARVEALGTDLRRLQVDQVWIEEVTRSVGDVAAEVAHAEQVVPIGAAITSGTEGLLFTRPEGLDRELLELTALGGKVSALSAAARAYVEDATPVMKEQIEGELAALEKRIQALAQEPPSMNSTAQETLDLVLGESGPFIAAVREVLRLRSQDDWSVTLSYSREIRPRFERIRTASSTLAQTQGMAMLNAAHTASLGTSVLVGLALLVGGLSAAGLYYSIRLEHRMRQIASTAQMLGQYAIEEPLGGGGMGDVYRARHALLRRPTAIKLLRQGTGLDPLAQDRFRREVQLTSQLTHPNTIQVFDYGRTPDGVLYYAMELLEGVDLQALITRTGPLPPARAVALLRQICGSLAEAHELGLLHRDLKPSNVMLTRRGGRWDVVKVLDFGLAAQMGESRLAADSAEAGKTVLAGTPGYMAPELSKGPERASIRSDLYAVGCIAYFIVTGHTVFPDEGLTALLAHHQSSEPPRPSARLGRAVPEALEAVILACLEKAPEMRPPSAHRLGQLFSASVAERWTEDDANAWWRDFGEALQADSRADARAASGESRA